MENKNPKIKISFSKKFLSTYALVGILVLVFSFGFAAGHLSQPGAASIKGGEVKNTETLPDFLKSDVDFQEFWSVWKYVKNNYVHADVPDTKLFYGAISGMVAALGDPYSVYFDPEVSDKFKQELSGSFEGIGAEIGIRDSHLTIIAPLAGTPAAKAGLQSGDMILKIDDRDTTDIALDYAVSIIRGPKGKSVALTIYRQGEDKPQVVSVVRDTIKIDSVRLGTANSTAKKNTPTTTDEFVLEPGGIAYIQLLYFNENTLSDWNKTIQQALDKNPKGIVLDLRNNPGGFLDTAIEIASDWVDGNVVVSEKFRDGSELSHKADRLARLAGIPTVVLVNNGSASASEIVSGALQDYGLAKIVGETTFGKGSVQDVHKFGDGSSVKLTIAEWFTPKGRNINKEGIKPDVSVELTKEEFDAGKDPQLDKAFAILRGK